MKQGDKNELEEMCDKLGVPRLVADRANSLFKKFMERKSVECGTMKMLVQHVCFLPAVKNGSSKHLKRSVQYLTCPRKRSSYVKTCFEDTENGWSAYQDGRCRIEILRQAQFTLYLKPLSKLLRRLQSLLQGEVQYL